MLDTVGVHVRVDLLATGPLRVPVGVGQRGMGREQLVPHRDRLCCQPADLGIRPIGPWSTSCPHAAGTLARIHRRPGGCRDRRLL